MKIIVFSDSHGDFESLVSAVEVESCVNIVIHLGDGSEEFGMLKKLYPHFTFYEVKGNNDWGSLESYSLRIRIDGHLIFLTHGHLFGVKQGLNRLATEGLVIGADLVLYGHTHIPRLDKFEKITIMNPGSINNTLNSGTYGIIETSEDKMDVSIKPLKVIEE